MYNFCTLFNSNYLTRGLTMYESLKEHSRDFHLFIFAFDERSYFLLKKLDLVNVTVISLAEFENEELLRIKGERSAGEYCWTCTPSIIKYSIEHYNLESCTYLDADLYFFSDPSILIEEMGENSVLITDHRYTQRYDQSATSGKYCVQFMTFKNTDSGLRVLKWWVAACIEWCFNRMEDGKFGDQKYLDDWTIRFEGVHELQHLGGGVAPWNIQQYNLVDDNFDLVFYHFHELKLLSNKKVDLGSYKLRKSDIQIVYRPYLENLENVGRVIAKIDPNYDYHGTITPSKGMKTLFRNFRKWISKSYNIYSWDQLSKI